MVSLPQQEWGKKDLPYGGVLIFKNFLKFLFPVFSLILGLVDTKD